MRVERISSRLPVREGVSKLYEPPAVRFMKSSTFMVKPPPTIPLAPSMPTLKSAMCMEPPLPLQLPVLLPKSSAIMCFRSAPLAMVWPCPLWVLWI